MRALVSMLFVCLWACSCGCSGGGRPGPTLEGTPAAKTHHVASKAPRPESLPAKKAPSRSETRHYRASWFEITKTSGCFFFSGPQGHGRDDKLGKRVRLTTQASGRVSLTFDKIRFDGGHRGGGLAFQRKSEHRFQGMWRIQEQITLKKGKPGLPRAFGGGAWVGEYRYQECEDKKGAPCPGRCRIHALLKLSPMR